MTDDAATPYRRHGLVHADPAAWSAMVADRPDLDPAMVAGSRLPVPNAEAVLADLDLVAGWADARRPLIVRRFHRGERHDHVPLGLQLPSRTGLRRVGFGLQARYLTAAAAPTYEHACAAAPAAWQTTLKTLLALGQRFGSEPRPYGSLLWQAATGWDYLRETSDLDLLWPLPDATCRPGFLEGLAEIATSAPMRLDGELLLPDGSDIHWRELYETPGDEDVLVKRIDRLELRPASDFRMRGCA